MHFNLFAQDQEPLVFTVGQTVFQVGDPGTQMYAVIAGAVEIVIHDKTVERVGPGGLFGEMALIEERVRSATAVVVEETKLVAIDRKRFTFLIQQNPFFALHLMEVMAARLRRENARL